MEVRTVQHAGGGVKGGPPRDGVQAGRPTAPASKALNRTSFDANRVSISFPFTPYQCQQVFVAKLVEALQKGQNALLESPTGTGKTLCLLCGALAWQQAYAAAVREVSRRGDLLSRALTEQGVSLEDMPGAGRVFMPPITGGSTGGPGGGRASDPAHAFRLGARAYTYADGGGGVGGGGGDPHGGLPAGGSGSLLFNELKLRTPVIIYASRTHSQLSQVVRELKASGYTPRMAVLGSRDTLCIHPQVSKMAGGTRNHACKMLTKARKCGFKVQLDEVSKSGGGLAKLLGGRGGGGGSGGGGGGAPAADNSSSFDSLAAASASAERLPVMDIEDLAALGREKGVCPYFLPRDAMVQASVELLLVPYNYLTDPVVRQQSLANVSMQGAVLIFDEAHNIEDVAADCASFDFTAASLADSIRDLRAALQPCVKVGTMEPEIDPTTLPFNLNDALTLLNMLLDFEVMIDKLELGPFPRGHPLAAKHGLPDEVSLEGRVDGGEFIYAMLGQFNINFATKDVMLDLLDNITGYMVSRDALAAGVSGSSVSLEAFRTILSRVFRDEEHANDLIDRYKVVVYRPDGKGGGGPRGPGHGSGPFSLSTRTGRTLAYWCFSPAVCMGELKALGVRSVILASGTLSPMDSYAAELRIPFPIRLENPHVIGPSQLYASVLSKGSSRGVLNSSFENRDKPEYKRELGNTISNIIRLVPDGVLVFFPAYAVMEACIAFWKADGGGNVWRAIEGSKVPVVESRGNADFAATIATFNEAVESKRGAAMFAVCRGKVSEGLDFADARGRAVVITGLPFAPRWDPKVALKRKYLDENIVKASSAKQSGAQYDRSLGTLGGGQWYSQQAFRAVNQAIGRVIRHRHDYGAILLLDERFGGGRESISAWIRPFLAVTDNFGNVVKGLVDFFKTAASEANARAAMGPVGGGSSSSSSSSSFTAVTPVYSAALGSVEPGQVVVGGGGAYGLRGNHPSAPAQPPGFMSSATGYAPLPGRLPPGGLLTQSQAGQYGVGGGARHPSDMRSQQEAAEAALDAEIERLQRKAAADRAPPLSAVAGTNGVEGGSGRRPVAGATMGGGGGGGGRGAPSLLAALNRPSAAPGATAKATAVSSAPSAGQGVPARVADPRASTLSTALSHAPRSFGLGSEPTRTAAAAAAAATTAAATTAAATTAAAAATTAALPPVSGAQTGASGRDDVVMEGSSGARKGVRSSAYMAAVKEVLGPERHSQLGIQLRALKQLMDAPPAASTEGGAGGLSPAPSASSSAGGGKLPAPSVQALIVSLHGLLVDAQTPAGKAREILHGFLDFVPKLNRGEMVRLMDRLLGGGGEGAAVAGGAPAAVGAASGAPSRSGAGQKRGGAPAEESKRRKPA